MSEAVSDAGASLLRHPPFARFWFSRILSMVAFQTLNVAIGWQLYAMTGSALDLGLVGLAQFVPMLLLTLAVGHAADRYDRRLIASICQSIEAVAATTLAFLAWRGDLSRETIFATVAVVGAARAFEGPSLAALLPTLVPRALIQRATAWSASAVQTAQIAGPALGGVLSGITPVVAYAAAGISFALAAMLAAAIPPPERAAGREPPTLASLFSGFGFIRRSPIVLGAISLDLLAVLLASVVALLPIYARDVLEVGPWGLGLLRAAPAVGALAMSITLARRSLGYPVGTTLFAAVATFGLATVIFGASEHLALSLLALATMGAADVVSVVIRMSLVQLYTPDEMRGRVSAVNAMFIGTSNQLGDFRAGLVASLLGVVPAVVAGGLCAIAVAALWPRLFPDLKRVRTFEA